MLESDRILQSDPIGSDSWVKLRPIVLVKCIVIKWGVIMILPLDPLVIPQPEFRSDPIGPAIGFIDLGNCMENWWKDVFSSNVGDDSLSFQVKLTKYLFSKFFKQNNIRTLLIHLERDVSSVFEEILLMIFFGGNYYYSKSSYHRILDHFLFEIAKTLIDSSKELSSFFFRRRYEW